MIELRPGPGCGEPAPLFVADTPTTSGLRFDGVAGRWVVLCFFGSAGGGEGRRLLDLLAVGRDGLFDDDRLVFFGVAADPADLAARRLDQAPGWRFFLDFDRAIAGRYGVNGGVRTFVIDPNLRISAVVELDDAADHAAALTDVLRGLPPPATYAGMPLRAPVLTVPRLFEPAFCAGLVSLYQAKGGEDSGFMRSRADGRTIGLIDHSAKRRDDVYIEDEAIQAAIRDRLVRRLTPEIQRCMHFAVSRIERYLIACYDGETGGFFRQHRDNTTAGTAHRRFAVTVNLNDGYDGGDLRFPEYGDGTYRAPAGGAIVFSCSLMHEARPVTRGRRYAFLPFLYDDAAAEIRRRNAHLIDKSGGSETRRRSISP